MRQPVLASNRRIGRIGKYSNVVMLLILLRNPGISNLVLRQAYP